MANSNQQENNSKSTKNFNSIADIGTERLHERIRNICLTDAKRDNTSLGGIDHQTASKWNETDQTYQLQRSYLFSEGVDYDLAFHPLHHLGYKIGVASVTDILSRNGKPEELAVNIAVPNKISVEHLEQLLTGLSRFCNTNEISFSTVDVTASQQLLLIATSVTGTASKNHLTSINNANVDDAICITGDIGGAIAGLRVLLREKKYWEQNQEEGFQPNLTEYEYVVQKQLLPDARYDFLDLIHSQSITPTAMYSASDGLIHGLTKIAKSSKAGYYIYQATLPIALPTRQIADEMGTDVDKYALYGGEDYEMIFTMPEDRIEKLKEHFNDYTVIGKVTDQNEGYCMQNAEGDVVKFEDQK